MRSLVFLALAVSFSGQAFAEAPVCVIEGTRRLLPAEVHRKDLSFYVSNSAGARGMLVKTSGPAAVEVTSSPNELQIIGLYRSENEMDERHVHCFDQKGEQICTVNTDSTPHVVPGSFEVDGTRLEVSIKEGVRLIKIETRRALDITSTTGDDISQRFHVVGQGRKFAVSCAGVKVKRVQEKYQQFAECGPRGC